MNWAAWFAIGTWVAAYLLADRRARRAEREADQWFSLYASLRMGLHEADWYSKETGKPRGPAKARPS